MYEFSSKEIRKKFKETEYGKKTNRWFYISLGLVIATFFMGFVFALLLAFKLINADSEILVPFTSILSGIFCIFVVISCYFDGKRDGAIEQFKSTLKK